MTWMLPRAVLAALAVLLGAGLAWLVGQWWPRQDWLPPLLGSLLGVAALFTVDSLRAHRLMKWLRGALVGSAPRDLGLWGELAYRMERAVRDRDRAIERERQELLQFLSAIEASPNGVLILDAADQIRWCNRVAADHFSLDPQRDRDQRVTNLVRFPSFVALLQSGEVTQPLVLTQVRGRLTLAVVVRPYGDGMRLVLTQDITERERAESMRRDFVANVSHEIRTPLTVLAGFIETMASLPLTEVERKRVLNLMGQQTERMQSLVSDLLSLAQLEGSPRPDADHWIGAQSLLQRVLADATALSNGRHALELHGGPNSELAGVEAELFSAVANLANNAVRYTPEGGRIDISFILLVDGSCEISVRDSGQGIAREHLPRLTERFYRVDGSRSRDTGGTGLGLSIVKHVAQRHGGELKIDSEVGKGSCFRLALPAARVRSIEALGVEAARVPERSH